MCDSVKNSLLGEISKVFEYYDNRILKLEGDIEQHKTEINDLRQQCKELDEKNSSLKEELADFSKVSIIKSLNNSLSEKDGQIKFLESQLKIINNKLEHIDSEPKNNELLEDITMVQGSPAPDEDTQSEPSVTNEPEPKPEPEPEPEPEQEDDSDEEVEVEFIEKVLRKKTYYVTDDDDREIYEKLDDGSLGELVGKYNDKGRPVFFKKK